MKNRNKLSFLGVAFMFTSAIMGAGFASGREIWQFFGVFSSNAKFGIIFIGVLFILTGVMTCVNSRYFNSNDMGIIIVPGGNRVLTEFVGYFMAMILFTVLVTMTAAGGSLTNQEFGISKSFGGLIILLLVLWAVIGEFERVYRIFRYIMPILFVVVLIVSILVIGKDMGNMGYETEIKPSPIANNYILASLLYISYNILSVIPIVATSSINAKSYKHALLGSILGGLMLAILAYVIVIALQKDMTFSQMLDLPMLGYSARLSPAIHGIYALVLMLSIYSSATSNFYGFTTKIKDGKNKNKYIICAGILGFSLGLIGFKNIVSYMFPVEGYLGFVIIILLFINFIKVMGKMRDERRKTQIRNIQ